MQLGIYLAGGGALIRVADFLTNALVVVVTVAPDPLRRRAGTAIVLKISSRIERPYSNPMMNSYQQNRYVMFRGCNSRMRLNSHTPCSVGIALERRLLVATVLSFLSLPWMCIGGHRSQLRSRPFSSIPKSQM